MHHPYFFAGREQELRDLIDNTAKCNVDLAACAGADPDAYHPEEGIPSERSLDRCTGCLARLACLALALRAEDPGERVGWYGGLGPADRDGVAAALRLEAPEPPPPDRAVEAGRLRAAGWTVNRIARSSAAVVAPFRDTYGCCLDACQDHEDRWASLARCGARCRGSRTPRQ